MARVANARRLEQRLIQAGDNPIVGAFKEAWRNFVRFIAGLIAALGVIVPVAAIAGAAYLLWRKLRSNK